MQGSTKKRCRNSECRSTRITKDGACQRCGGESWGWSVVYDLGPDPVTGRRRQRRKDGFDTKEDADRYLRKQLTSVDTNSHVDPSKITLREFLNERWLPATKPRVSANHYRNVEVEVRCHIVPRLGALLLQGVDAPHLLAFFGELAETGRRDGKGLSPKSIANIRGTLHRAFEDAVRWRLTPRNPVADVDSPAKADDGDELQVWSVDELRAFLAHVEDHPLHAFWTLLATTGMRRGEGLGLRWSDVDLGGAKLRITQQLTETNGRLQFKRPKTKKGRRTLSLDPVTVAAFKRRKADQAAQQLAAGPKWSNDRGLVFTDDDGAPLIPGNVSKWIRPLARQAGVPEIRVHDIRHTYATIMLASGKSPKLISERLGHASIAETFDRYAAWIPGHDEDVAAAGAELIFGALEAVQ